MTKKTAVTLILIIVLIAGGLVAWYFWMNRGSQPTVYIAPQPTNGFQPLNGGSTPPKQQNPPATSSPNPIGTTTVGINQTPIPSLRLLSNTPVGGYGAMTSASTTVIHWIDRGRGNIYEAREDSLAITTLSNTLVPMIYQSTWNATLNAFMSSMFNSDSVALDTVYVSLLPQQTNAGTSSETVTPYELKGKNLPATIVSYAASPKKDRIFLFSVENGRGIGYIAPFNGGTATEIFDSPITQVNVEWPEDNTIAITTKGSADEAGFLYFVNPTTGIWKKILGPIPGLSTKVSHDAKNVLVSFTDGGQGVLTTIYNVAKGSGTDAIIRTLADKCAWGNFYKNLVYCGVPLQPVAGTYPDDWYKGTLSTIDKIWQVNADTGEVHQISSIVDQSDRVIDTFNLGLDSHDNYLFFMNKNDLSLWSLDLVSSNQGN